MVQSIQPDDADDDRYDRTRRIEWIDLPSIESAQVLVVGAGALGNEVMKNLVLSGFSDITLFDMDHVVRSNLNRCVFFREEDAEQRVMKADIVAERSRVLNPGVDIEPRVERIEDMEEDKWGEYDLVLGCLDNIMARLHVNSHSYDVSVPYIDGGTSGMNGKVQVVLPPSSPCLQCSMNRTHYRVIEKRLSCTGEDVSFFEPKMPAEITTTSVVGALQVREAIKIISGNERDCIQNILYYDGKNGRSEILQISKDPSCSLH